VFILVASTIFSFFFRSFFFCSFTFATTSFTITGTCISNRLVLFRIIYFFLSISYFFKSFFNLSFLISFFMCFYLSFSFCCFYLSLFWSLLFLFLWFVIFYYFFYTFLNFWVNMDICRWAEGRSVSCFHPVEIFGSINQLIRSLIGSSWLIITLNLRVECGPSISKIGWSVSCILIGNRVYNMHSLWVTSKRMLWPWDINL